MYLCFWSGQSFGEAILQNTGSFKAAQIVFKSVGEIDQKGMAKLLIKSQINQWDYKNIVKRKGRLDKLTEF